MFITFGVPFKPKRGVFRTSGKEPKNHILSNNLFRVLDDVELNSSRTSVVEQESALKT